MGFLGDSIPNIIVSVLFLAAKIGIFLFIFQIFEQRNQKKFIFLSSSFIYQPSILFSQPSLTSLSPSAIAHLSLCHFYARNKTIMCAKREKSRVKRKRKEG